jgi:predicted DNA-binding WGR domain protein
MGDNMKRIFCLKDEKSNKYWSIDINGTNLITQFGKIKDNIIGEEGQVSEKSFEDEAACIKEANKLIMQKTKNGYMEQDPLFIKLNNCIHFGKSYDASNILTVLQELDTHAEKIKVNFSVHGWIYQMYRFFYQKNINLPPKTFDINYNEMTALVYHLPKFEATSEEINNELLQLYAYGLRIAVCTKNKDLEQFSLEHLPKEVTESNHAVGLAYVAAANGEKEDIVKYMCIGFKGNKGADPQPLKDDKLFAPYQEELKKAFRIACPLNAF